MQTADRILCIGRSSFVRTGSPQRERTILKGCSVCQLSEFPQKRMCHFVKLVKPALQNGGHCLKAFALVCHSIQMKNIARPQVAQA